MLTKKLPIQGYVAPRWSHRYKHSTIIITIYISNDNGYFTFYVDVFFPLSLPRLLLNLTVYMSNTAGVL
jgi:hypothetical protein